MEFAAEPHQMLREVERVLIPEGRLIVTGFNQTSLWGARQFVGRLNKNYYLPHEGRVHQPGSFERLAEIIKYGNRASAFQLLRTRLAILKMVASFSIHGKSRQRWWPYSGSVHVMQELNGYVACMIGPALKQKRVVRGARDSGRK
jgi:hypothetical protein